MSLQNLTRYATATLAVTACVFVVSSVGAVELNDDQRRALSDPVSTPCHPALRVCVTHAQRLAAERAARSEPISLAYESTAQIVGSPELGVCHPARGACATRPSD